MRIRVAPSVTAMPSCSQSTTPHYPPSIPFAKGIRSRGRGLLACFDEPTANGYAEGVINEVKVITRRGVELTFRPAELSPGLH
jgi:hypothetical protein